MKHTIAATIGAILLAGSVSAARVCGTEQRSASKIAEKQSEFLKRVPSASFSPAAEDVPIPVVFHVIHTGPSYDEGYLTAADIKSQIDVLNHDYLGTGFQFYLSNTTYTQYQPWFDSAIPNAQEQTDMKEYLRQGTEATLNLYSVAFTDYPGLLGYAVFPDWYANAPLDDGVVLQWRSLPNGTYAPFDLGKTASHEVGHWMGLYHTFQDGCTGGDLVDDTPPEASPASGCPVGRDTCKSDTFPDPIHNYMDYSDDACLTEFTPGQITRMTQQWAVYRAKGWYPQGSEPPVTPKPPLPPVTPNDPCPHDKCKTGKPLKKECDPCVAQIIALDPFCGSSGWDSICVSEVQSICGLSC